MKKENIKQYIELYQLNSIFSESTLEQLNRVEYSAGDFFVRSGDEVDHLFILVKGKLKVSTALPNGRTMLLRFAYPLSLLGDIELVDKEQAKVHVQVLAPSTFLTVPYSVIHEYEMKRAPFLHYLLQHICTKMNTNFHSATMNILTNVEQRFASYLLSMSNLTDQQFYSREELETGKLTDIAEMLGTSYRHLNRIAKKFTDEQLIIREKKKIIIINVDGLKEKCVDQRVITK